MKALVTTPQKYVHYSIATEATMVFGLAHLATEGTEASSFYGQSLRHASKNLGAHLIIDNGVTELGKPLHLTSLCQIAADVCANEIVLPDEYRDAATTREYVQQDLVQLARRPILAKFMAVIHEQNADDLARTLEEWAKHEPIQVLGVPKHQTTSWYWPEGRRSILKVIENLEFHTRFDVHLLGVWEDIREVQTIARGFPWVRSVDSSWPIMAGLAGVDIVKAPNLKVPYEADPKSTSNTELILHNIAAFQRLASGE